MLFFEGKKIIFVIEVNLEMFYYNKESTDLIADVQERQNKSVSTASHWDFTDV